jgi:hypothetical protein
MLNMSPCGNAAYVLPQRLQPTKTRLNGKRRDSAARTQTVDSNRLH